MAQRTGKLGKSDTVGAALRDLRKRTKFGIKTVAPKVGVSYTYLSKIENNVKLPSPGLVLMLCNLYGADADNLIAKLGAVPEDIQEIVKEHGKGAFDLLRSTYSSD